MWLYEPVCAMDIMVFLPLSLQMDHISFPQGIVAEFALEIYLAQEL